MSFLRRIASKFKTYIKVKCIYIYKYIVLRDLLDIDAIKKKDPSYNIILDKVKNAGVSNVAYFKNGYSFEGGLLLQQNPYEYAALASFLRATPDLKFYLEIGSASGGSCYFLNEICNFSKIVSIDDGRHPQANHQKANFFKLNNFTQYLGDSHSTKAYEFLSQVALEPIDVAFIDGDHSFIGVKQDLELVLKFSRKGTILVFHDTDPAASLGVAELWIHAIRKKRMKPLAEFIGDEIPLGIGIAIVI